MSQRLAAADTIIFTDMSFTNFLRYYIKRYFSDSDRRVGRLKGAKGEIRFNHIWHSFYRYPKNRKKYLKLMVGSGKKVIVVRTMKELNSLYQQLGLSS